MSKKLITLPTKDDTGENRKLQLSCGAAADRPTVKVRQYTWGELIDLLSKPARTPETIAQYRAMSKADKAKTKDIGYFIGGRSIDGRRKALSVPRLDVIALDADRTPNNWRSTLKNEMTGSWCAYSTHSSTADNPRLRIVVPCRRSISIGEHAFLSRLIAARIGEGWFDDAGFRPNQPMFWPSCPSDAEFEFEAQEGPWLDPDKILRDFPNWQDRSTWPIQPKDIAHEGKIRAEDPPEKKGIVGAFCRVYDILEAIEEFIPGTYKEGKEGRLTYAEGSTINGAVLYNDSRWLYSHHGTDPAAGRLCNAYDLIRIHKFGQEEEGKSNKAMRDLAMADSRVKVELLANKHQDAVEEFGAETENPDGWRNLLHISDNGVVSPSYRNCLVIIENDPHLKKCVAENDFTGSQMKVREFGGDAIQPREWGKKEDSYVREYLEATYRVVFSPMVIRDALIGAAVKNSFHPVRDWLSGLEWDGVKRAETLFIDFLGCADNAYTRAACRKMLSAAVARVFRPGTKYDNVVILEGKQGGGKSTFWRILSNEWFCELETFEAKTAAEIIQGCWLGEIPELESLPRFGSDRTKAFLSKCSDRYREAYAVRAQDRPRQCIFVGSTNNDEYLQDRTGNRRYLPIKISKSEQDPVDFATLKKAVPQVWAEVMTWELVGLEPLFMDTPELQKIAGEEQHNRLSADDWEGIVLKWMDEKGVEETCVAQVWAECLEGDTVKLDFKDRRRIGTILRSIGLEACGVRTHKDYGRQKTFRRDSPF